MKPVGIEKLNIYGCSLCLVLSELAAARGKDPNVLERDYLIRVRSLNPLYEDVVTMAANAAAPLLSTEDREQIGLLIFATESGMDFSKPVSTNVHEALGLPPNVRNFELKHACYGGVAALECALNWIGSGAHRGKKALILAADFSRKHLNQQTEFILGGAAAALLVSDTPRVIAYEPMKTGFWTSNVYDFFRPNAVDELIDNELSLFSYLEALDGAYQHYVANTGTTLDLADHFQYLVYHMPFPGMAFQAHRSLCNRERPRQRTELLASFNEKVRPSLRYAAQVGSTYSASNFVGLCGLIDDDRDRLRPGDRIGFFAYGSGAIGQFYSGLIMPEAVETIEAMTINEAFQERRRVTPDEYETLERLREEAAVAAEFSPPLDFPKGWYDEHYRGKRRLVLKRVSGFRREYQWS
jgi:3-hydroxy-3-methylglutaryl CoA synthase